LNHTKRVIPLGFSTACPLPAAKASDLILGTAASPPFLRAQRGSLALAGERRITLPQGDDTTLNHTKRVIALGFFDGVPFACGKGV
jgi:hypothetical protein